MLYAYKWALNDGFSGASVHLMRAAICLRNLETQKLERIHHIGRMKTEKSSKKRGSKYDNVIPQMQKHIDKYIDVHKGAAIFERSVHTHLKNKGYELSLGTFQKFVSEKKIKLK